MVKTSAYNAETWVWFLSWEDPLEKEMATYSIIRAWKMPWMEEPGRLQSMGSQRVGHNWGLHFLTIRWCHLFWPPRTSKEPSCVCIVVKISWTLRMRNLWSFISYLGRAQLLLPLAILEYLSTEDDFSCLAWVPSISCLNLISIMCKTFEQRMEYSRTRGRQWYWL